MAGFCTNTSNMSANELEDVLERCQTQKKIVLGLVYGSMHTNMHALPKGTPTAPIPKAAKKLMGVTLYVPHGQYFKC